MTSREKYNEQRKLEEELYYNDYIEDDKEFCYEIGYFDAYSIGDEVIFSDFD